MIPLIRLEGSPRECGRQHGAAAAAQIASNVEIYSRWFEQTGVGWERALQAAPEFLAAFAAYDPALAEELEGIAEGAGRPVAEIVALNARTEIYYGVSGVLNRPAPTECSTLGVAPEGAAGGGTYVAQTWDWLCSVLGNVVLLHIRQPGRPEVLTFTEAGMLGKIGVNSEGVALCVNLLASNQNGVGMTFHTLARAALHAGSLVEALYQVTRARRAGSGHFLFGRKGEVASLEFAPGDYHVHYPRRGVVGHTNHFIAQLHGLRDRSKLYPHASPGTYLRQGRLDDLLQSQAGFLDRERIAAILSDHRHQPEAICRHPNEGVTPDNQTNLAVIFDLDNQELWYTEGPACQGEWRRMAFPWRQ